MSYLINCRSKHLIQVYAIVQLIKKKLRGKGLQIKYFLFLISKLWISLVFYYFLIPIFARVLMQKSKLKWNHVIVDVPPYTILNSKLFMTLSLLS